MKNLPFNLIFCFILVSGPQYANSTFLEVNPGNSLPNKNVEMADSLISNEYDKSAILSLKEEIAKGEKLWLTNKEESEKVVLNIFRRIENEKINDTSLADLYHLYGKLLIDQDKSLRGIDTVKQSLRIKTRIYGENKPELAKTVNYIGIGYYQLREFDSAMYYYVLTAEILDVNDTVTRDMFDSYLNRASVMIATGKYDISLKYFNKALEVLNSIETPADSMLRARFYSSYGLLATYNGKLEQALRYYDMAENIVLQLFGPYDSRLGNIYSCKGMNANINFNFDQALLYYQKAINISLTNSKLEFRIPGYYANMSSTANKMKNYSKAIYYSREGLKYKSYSDNKFLLLLNLSRYFAALDNTDSAGIYYQKTLDFVENNKLNPNRKIILFEEYGDFLIETRQYKSGKYYIESALKASFEYYEHHGKRSASTASLLSRLGDYQHSINKDYDSAVYFYNQSINIWKKYFSRNDGKISRGGVIEIEFIDAYSGLAATYYYMYRGSGDTALLMSSLYTYRQLFKHSDKITGLLNRESSFIFSDKLKKNYSQSIEIVYQLFQITKDYKYLQEAFELSEKSKSAVLIKTVKNNSAMIIAGIPEMVSNIDIQLQNEINGLRKLLEDENKKARKSKINIAFFNSKLLELSLRHDSLITEIENNYPKYYALKYDYSVIDLKTIKSKLDKEEMVIEYTLTDSNLYIIAVNSKTFEFKKVQTDSTFYEALQYMIDLKSKNISQLAIEDPNSFIEYSNILWAYLIGPVYESIRDKSIVIIPDGQLGYLTFDILINPHIDLENSGFRHLPYLITENPVSYAYSATLRYSSYFSENGTSKENILTFASDYESDTEGENRFRTLPFAVNEADKVKQIIGGKAFKNNNATKSEFLKQAPNFNIIHLALHTKINDSMPMYSELVFSKEMTDSSNGVLRTYELFGMDLSADLVTLSACKTGTGKLQQGEGIMNLARGFIYAGVPSIVMTLWDVQDLSSIQIMEGFYTYLKEGYPKDKAMQLAKLDYLAESNMLKSHPYFWSLYIVSGETSEITLHKANTNYYVFLGLGILLLLILIRFIKRKSVKIT